jgi:hypothetical protein
MRRLERNQFCGVMLTLFSSSSDAALVKSPLSNAVDGNDSFRFLKRYLEYREYQFAF